MVCAPRAEDGSGVAEVELLPWYKHVAVRSEGVGAGMVLQDYSRPLDTVKSFKYLGCLPPQDSRQSVPDLLRLLEVDDEYRPLTSCGCEEATQVFE